MTDLTASEQDILHRVDAWLTEHRDEFAADIRDWVAVPSVSDATQAQPGAPFGPEVARVLDLARARAHEFGFETTTHEGYAVTILGEGDPQLPEIGLASHLDVVPAGDNWTFEPYEPFERDGFIIGRGASDNKGPAVGDLYLLRLFRDLGLPLRHRLRVIYGGAEETGMADLAYYAEHGPVPRVSIVTDGPFPVNFAQKGGLNVRLFIPTGPVLSAFRAGVAENAVPATAEILLPEVSADTVLDSLTSLPDDLRSTLSVTQHAGGVTLLARGQSGHAAFPEGTSNAILLLAHALESNSLLDDADRAAAAAIARILQTPYGDGAGTAREDAESGRLTQNGGLVIPTEGGIALHLDIRYPISVTATDLIDALTAALTSVGGHVLDFVNASPFHIDRNDSIVTVLQGTFNAVLGVDTQPFAMGGGTHSRVLPNAITFGPGLGRIPGALPAGEEPRRPDFIAPENGTPHGPDEFVSIDNLFTALRIYVIALLRLDEALQHE